MIMGQFWYIWYIGLVATKKHAASMLIDQQQKPTKTLQEYVQNYHTYSLSPAAYYCTRLKIWLT